MVPSRGMKAPAASRENSSQVFMGEEVCYLGSIDLPELRAFQV
jgi:hypothetical protein